MTLDERIERLMQSIESHDRQIGELVERTNRAEANLTARLDALDARVDRFIETTQLNFDRVQLSIERLATAMLGLTDHISDHQNRIEKLENR